MHDFDGRRQLGDPGGGGSVEGFVCREYERRAQPLAFAEQTVADDLISACCRCQYRVDAGASVREIAS